MIAAASRHMVEVSVGQKQQVHPLSGERFISPLRGVKKDVSTGRFVEKTVGIEHSARKGFEPFHEKMVLKI